MAALKNKFAHLDLIVDRSACQKLPHRQAKTSIRTFRCYLTEYLLTEDHIEHVAGSGTQLNLALEHVQQVPIAK